MQKVVRYAYLLLRNTFIITAICLFVAWIGGTNSFLESVFGVIGLYGAFLTGFFFLIHVSVLILAFITKGRNSD